MQAKGSYRLTVRQGPVPGKLIELVKDVLVIGRDVNNDIVVNDAEVSRTHTRLTQQADGYLVEDLASTNGTFINGQRLTTPKLLRSGDMLGLGETVVLEFSQARDSDSTVVASSSAVPFAPAETMSSTPPPPSEAPKVTGPFTSESSAPAEPYSSAPASSLPGTSTPPASDMVAPPKRNNRTLIIGVTCGCLTLCVCLALVLGLYYAYNAGTLCQISSSLCP